MSYSEELEMSINSLTSVKERVKEDQSDTHFPSMEKGSSDRLGIVLYHLRQAESNLKKAYYELRNMGL